MGGVRRAAAGRPTPTPGIKPATQVATARRNRASGGGLCVIARGTKEQKPPFSVFFLPVFPVCRGAFFKVYGTFFVWFLVGKDRGSVVISMRKREEADVLRNRTVLKRPYQEGARAQACGNGNHRRHRDHVSRAPRWREKTGTAQLKRRVLCTAPPLRPPDPTSTAMARGNQEGARAHKRAEMETIDDTAMT